MRVHFILSVADRKRVKKLAAQGATISEIAFDLDTTEEAVRQAAAKLHLTIARRRVQQSQDHCLCGATSVENPSAQVAERFLCLDCRAQRIVHRLSRGVRCLEVAA